MKNVFDSLLCGPKLSIYLYTRVYYSLLKDNCGEFVFLITEID